MRNRRRDARHPIVIGTLTLAGVVAASQLFFGPVGSSVVRDMDYWSQQAFSLLLLCSVAACLISAIIVREPLGARIERAGMLGCALALTVYAFNVPGSVASWNTSMAAVFGGTALGAAVRAALVWRMIRQRETP